MPIYNLITLIIVLTAIFEYVNFKYVKLPGTIGVMLLSLIASLLIIAIGLLHPDFFIETKRIISTIDFHTALMKVMLSFLLFAGSIHIDLNLLKKESVSIFAFSTIGVLVSTFCVAGLFFIAANCFGLPINFLSCLLFGALISPTDPIAVLGILKNAKIPATLEMKISGESLFNDGVAVVVFITIAEIIPAGIQNITVMQIGWMFLKEAGDNQPDKGEYFKYCGQRFWEFISGDKELFTKIIEPLGHQAKERNDDFLISYSKMINLFTKEFSDTFCKRDGAIDWEKLVRFNSAQ